MNKKIQELITQADLKTLIKVYSVKEVCDVLSFAECLELAHKVFEEKTSPPTIKNFAIELLLEVRRRNLREWEKSWENDYFLGKLSESCGTRKEIQFAAYRRAHLLCPNAPVSLLIAVSDCRGYPGIPNLTDKEAEIALKKARTKNPTPEESLAIEERLHQINIVQRESKELDEEYKAEKTDLKKYIDAHDWNAIANNISIETVVYALPLESVWLLAYSIYFNVDWSDSPQLHLMTDWLEYHAVSLLTQAQDTLHHEEAWKKDWSYDVFLAYLCFIIGKGSGMFSACKRALAATNKQSSEVCALMACCEWIPYVDEITIDESIALCTHAYELNNSPRAAAKLRQIYLRQQNQEKAAYWDSICKQLALEGRKEAIIIPDVLSDPRITCHLIPYLEDALILP